MFERFTVQAREVLVNAVQAARDLDHEFVGTEHLLLALLRPEVGITSRVLTTAGVSEARVRAEIERLVGTPGKILGDEDAAALRTIGIDLDAVLASIEASLGSDPRHPDGAPVPGCSPRRRRGSRTRLARRAKKVMELSLREALRRKDDSIGSEHILLGLLREGGGLAARILVGTGLSLDDLRQQTLDALDEAA